MVRRIRNLARILRGEHAVEAASYAAIRVLLDDAGARMKAEGLSLDVLDDRDPVWHEALRTGVLPPIETVFTQAFDAVAAGTLIDPTPYATRHLEAVWNRLVGVSHEVFDVIRTTLEEGRLLGEDVPTLAKRVDATLSDDERWRNRATLIARTEVIGSNNAGAQGAAGAVAHTLGVPGGAVVKEWLSSHDTRVRAAHAAADGQQVYGMDALFSVGGSGLLYPGDPSGPASQVCNCRCTPLYLMPGDPDYPDSGALVAAADPMEDPMTEQTPEEDETRSGVVLVALPAADDPANGIGAEEKHATLLWFGDMDDNPGLTDDFRTLLSQVASIVAENHGPFTATVEGVESLGDDCARVWMLGGADLPQIRDALLDTDSEVLGPWEAVEQYPTFTPHSTIGYPDPASADGPALPVEEGGECATLPQDVEQAAAAVESITFDRLALWWAGEQTEWTLGAPAGAAVTAAGDFDWAAALVNARLDGAPYAELADRFGYTSAGAARKALMRALEAAERPADPVEAPEATDITAGPQEDDMADQYARDGVRGKGDGPGGGKGGGAGPAAGGKSGPAGGGGSGTESPTMKRAKQVHRDTAHDADVTSSKADEASRTARSNPTRETIETAKAQHTKAIKEQKKAVKTAKDAEDGEAATEHRRKVESHENEIGELTGLARKNRLSAATQVGTADEYLQVPDDVPALAQDIDPEGEPFYGIVAPEGVYSDDARGFGLDSMVARDLPLPLMYQDAQASGHDGAVRVGRIDNVWRDTETYETPVIRFDGAWDTSETAAEAQRQVEKGVAKGVSVDGVNVTTRLVDSAGNTLDPLADTPPEDGVVNELAESVKMAGLTICSVPAFEQTYIANGRYEDRTEPEPGQTPREPLPTGGPDGPGAEAPDDGEDPEEAEALVAAATTTERAPTWTLGLVASAEGDGDWVVPAAHFTDPGLETATALTVTPEGRVYGHLATWGQCHIGTAAGRRGEQVKAAGKCMEVPTSASGYAFFATGVVHTDDGGMVNVGQLTMDTGHANLRYGASDTVDHYDNTGSPVADIVVGHDAIGIWFSGHVRPTATPQQVYSMTASGSVSGDWREVVRRSNQLELVAALVVNVPGFPIGRPAVTRSAGGPVSLVASGAVVPETPVSVGTATVELTTPDGTALVASITREVIASIARQQRAQAAARRVRTHRALKAAARLNRKGA